MSRAEKIRQVQEAVGGDVTQSVIGQTLDAVGGNVDQAKQFFQNVAPPAVETPFDQEVSFLMDMIKIGGVPRYVYADVLRECNGEMSAAVDKMLEIRNDVVYNHKKFEDPDKPKPAAAAPKPAAAAAAPKPAAAAAAPKPAAAAAAPKPAAAAAAAPQPAAAAAAPKPAGEAKKPPAPGAVALPVFVPSKPAEQPKPVEPKPVEPQPQPVEQSKHAGRSVADVAADIDNSVNKLLDDQAKQNVLLDRSRKEDEAKVKILEEKRKHLESAWKRKEQEKQKIELQLKNPELDAKTRDGLLVQHHKNMADMYFIQSVINPEALLPPDYQIGRLPTEECEIRVTGVPGEDGKINFTWSIPDTVQTHPKDWIGLFIHDREFSNKVFKYIFLEGQHQGVGDFPAPGDGTYDLRFYPDNAYVEHSRSEPFLVGKPMPLHIERVDRHKIAVSWEKSLQQPGDWLALYTVGTYSNTKYLQRPANASNANKEGKVIFDLPREPGEYEIRYFFTNKKQANGYAYSGRSEPIVVVNEDKMEVVATHPIVKVHWQTFSQEPRSRDWVGLYPSTDDSAKYMAYTYLSSKGLMDEYGDNGFAEIEVKELMNLAPDAPLPEEAVNWEVRLFNGTSSSVPFLRAPFLKPKEK